MTLQFTFYMYLFCTSTNSWCTDPEQWIFYYLYFCDTLQSLTFSFRKKTRGIYFKLFILNFWPIDVKQIRSGWFTISSNILPLIIH